ncbi:hypothetical protein VmeM32_00141 [Vibrio phage vB_VmeM-32]|nr:hypothetical protein VmeM32_00141 [Vibrio phage vB_VmeM-32]
MNTKFTIMERLSLMIILPFLLVIAFILWLNDNQTKVFKKMQSAILYGDINHYKETEKNEIDKTSN